MAVSPEAGRVELPGVATMRLEWKAQGLAPQTLRHYCDLLTRLDRELPSGVLGADRDELAATLARYSPSQVAWALRALRRWARYAPAGHADATAGMRRPKPADLLQPTATAEHVDARLASVAALADPTRRQVRAATVVSVLWSARCRIGELARLEWEDVDLAEGLVTIRKSKTGKPRTTIVDATAIAWLKRWQAVSGRSSGRVFVEQKRCLQRDVTDVLGAEYPPHSLQRGWAVESLRAGISQVTVQYAAGWASGAMCQRYVRTLSQELAVAEFRAKRAS
jgi:integrase/recombinase XerC